MSAIPFDRDALNRAYRYCCSLCNDPTAAADLLQDGLERYLRSEVHPDNPDAMLRRILHNRFIDTLRTRRQEDPIDSGNLDAQLLVMGLNSLEDQVIAQDELDRLWHSLQPAERELLHLWAVDGYTAHEIAELQGCPRGTVLARIFRLRQRLNQERTMPHRAGDKL